MKRDATSTALRRSGIPGQYCRPELTLGSIPQGAPYLQWINGSLRSAIREGGVVEILGESIDALNLYYLGLRAMVLGQHACQALHVQELLDQEQREDVNERLHNVFVLGVRGLCEDESLSASQAGYLGWFLESWLHGPGVVVMLNASPFSQAHKFSPLVRASFRAQTKLTLNV